MSLFSFSSGCLPSPLSGCWWRISSTGCHRPCRRPSRASPAGSLSRQPCLMYSTAPPSCCLTGTGWVRAHNTHITTASGIELTAVSRLSSFNKTQNWCSLSHRAVTEHPDFTGLDHQKQRIKWWTCLFKWNYWLFWTTPEPQANKRIKIHWLFKAPKC